MTNICTSNPKSLWVDGINAAAFIINILVSKICSQKWTPFQAIHGRKPDFSRVWIFGCKEFFHIPKALRNGKFKEKSKQGTLARYDAGNVYFILLEESRKILISQDVEFDENFIGTHTADESQSKLMGFKLVDMESEIFGEESVQCVN